MSSSPSLVGRVRPLETPDPNHVEPEPKPEPEPDDVIVTSTQPGESPAVLYDVQELAFMAWINEPQHRNIFRLTYAQYREYRYWCEHPDEPSKGPTAANMKHRAKKFEMRDGVLYRKPHIVREDSKSKKSFGYRRVIQAELVFYLFLLVFALC